MTVPLIVCGAAGRMGRALVRLIHEDPNAHLHAAVENPGNPAIGIDAGVLAGVGEIGIAIGDRYGAVATAASVALDFTTPDASLAHLRAAVEIGAGIAIGTTGFEPAQRAELEGLAQHTRTIIASNMSVGVNVLLKLVRDAASALREGFDPEIVEMHHRNKVDAPSGTALSLGRAVADGTDRDFERDAVLSRAGLVGARTDREIGIMTLRGGDVVGDHTVIFAGSGERVELTHRAQSRDCLARGAVRAGLWLEKRQPGLYTMADVLGL
jgi:4-hydroxy-tetrahydrodipicolinate reductase